MVKHSFLYGLFALLFILATLTYIGYISPSQFVQDVFGTHYKYEESQQGIRFVSNEGKPTALLQQLAQANSFVLVPHASASIADGYNAYWTQALVQQEIVLGGHQKNALIATKVFDEQNGTWKGCQTDYATAKQNQFISVSECQGLLDTPHSAVIEIEFPDAHLRAPIVEITSQKITIRPVLGKDIPGVNFLLMRAMFSDSEQLIGAANEVVKQRPSSK
jgi:hypothetical protein